MRPLAAVEQRLSSGPREPVCADRLIQKPREASTMADGDRAILYRSVQAFDQTELTGRATAARGGSEPLMSTNTPDYTLATSRDPPACVEYLRITAIFVCS